MIVLIHLGEADLCLGQTSACQCHGLHAAGACHALLSHLRSETTRILGLVTEHLSRISDTHALRFRSVWTWFSVVLVPVRICILACTTNKKTLHPAQPVPNRQHEIYICGCYIRPSLIPTHEHDLAKGLHLQTYHAQPRIIHPTWAAHVTINRKI